MHMTTQFRMPFTGGKTPAFTRMNKPSFISLPKGMAPQHGRTTPGTNLVRISTFSQMENRRTYIDHFGDDKLTLCSWNHPTIITAELNFTKQLYESKKSKTPEKLFCDVISY